MGENKSYQSWTILDEFWEAIKDEIPNAVAPAGNESVPVADAGVWQGYG